MINIFPVSVSNRSHYNRKYLLNKSKDYIFSDKSYHLTLEISSLLYNRGLPLWLGWWISLQCRRPGFDPWVGKIPWKRERLPTPVFWPGEFYGLYSPWGRKEFHNWATFTSLYNRWWKKRKKKKLFSDAQGNTDVTS